MDALVRPFLTRNRSDEGVQATFFNRLLGGRLPAGQSEQGDGPRFFATTVAATRTITTVTAGAFEPVLLIGPVCGQMPVL